VLTKLPGWIVDDATSVREEVADWVNASPAERWRLARLCARDALWAARASGMRERILEQVDALPESSIRALARLRGVEGWGRVPR
jgi:hypothetical protein